MFPAAIADSEQRRYGSDMRHPFRRRTAQRDARERAAEDLRRLRAQSERMGRVTEHAEPGTVADDLRYTITGQGLTP